MRRRPTHEEMMEIGDLGMAIYEREIDQHLTDDDHGKLIAIDVDTGEWVLGAGAVRAMDANNPDARILNMVHTVGPTIGFGGSSFYTKPEDTALASGR